MSTYRIGSRGYVIQKSSLTPIELEQLKKGLSIYPKENHSIKLVPSTERAVIVYRENEEKIYLPRFFGINQYGIPERIDLSSGDDIDVPFQKSLRDYQHDIINVYLDHVKDGHGGGILEVPCGRGKTIMALYIISMLKKKTLVIVHKEFLLNQWVERIREFIPSARIGKIQGKVFDVENIRIVRPGDGASPHLYYQLLGRKARRAYSCGTPLSLEQLL